MFANTDTECNFLFGQNLEFDLRTITYVLVFSHIAKENQLEIYKVPAKMPRTVIYNERN